MGQGRHGALIERQTLARRDRIFHPGTLDQAARRRAALIDASGREFAGIDGRRQRAEYPPDCTKRWLDTFVCCSAIFNKPITQGGDRSLARRAGPGKRTLMLESLFGGQLPKLVILILDGTCWDFGGPIWLLAVDSMLLGLGVARPQCAAGYATG